MGTVARLFGIAGLLAGLLQPGCSSGQSAGLEVPVPDAGAGADSPTNTGRRIVPQDVLQVTVFEAPELTRAVRVSEAGDISLPLLGLVKAAGGTPRELEAVLAAGLRTYMHEPHVSVAVTEPAEEPVYVLGEVNQPGAFTSSTGDGITVLRALSLARGFSQAAAASRTVVIRSGPGGQREQVPVDLEEMLRGRSPDLALRPNDVLYVPKNSQKAVVAGVVDALLRVVTFRTVF